MNNSFINYLQSKLYESVIACKARKYESELVAFLEMVKEIRGNVLFEFRINIYGPFSYFHFHFQPIIDLVILLPIPAM